MTSTQPLWNPSTQQIANTNLMRFVRDELQGHVPTDVDYPSLQQWSVDHPNEFWPAIMHWGKICFQGEYQQALSPAPNFMDNRWFSGITLNYTENLLSKADDTLALVARMEDGSRRQLTYRQLNDEVAAVSAALKNLGVTAGDRVAGWLPNVPETVIAMLATASLGAIWSSCSPDFGAAGVIDRFGQITPKVLFACDGYFYNGKTIECYNKINEVLAELKSIGTVILVPTADLAINLDQNSKVKHYQDFIEPHRGVDLEYTQMPFDHPLFIMYSSGTTGKPKCIVHGAGGTLLQHIKEVSLHSDVSAGDTLFYYTTTGWAMWNWLVSGLSLGATLVLYDGSPFFPHDATMMDIAQDEGINIFGTSAKYIASLEKAGVKPKETHNLSSLRSILSTGSPLSHESFRYVYRDVKKDVCLSSISGGTDIISCFVLGCPTLPVWEGEIQCIGLGMAVECWDEQGVSVTQQKAELVCTKPFPSMPIGFWNDPDRSKFSAAYFEQFPNVWAHGDFAEITEHQGMIIHGRSDTILNPGGVRIGTAEIYRQVQKVPEVLDSLCIGQDWNDDVRVVLFVVLKDGEVLTNTLRDKIKKTIRAETTPRHVPSKIIAVADVPRTITGKLVELAVRNVVHHRPVVNTDALANPQSLSLFKDLPELRED
ncbi:MAG: acetoacetate--CoA ligase [Halieaceae bacterium]|nr:acetoacetate--CoA ligase [Halieaceae bacterium]